MSDIKVFMNILLSNDDGINSKSLYSLCKVLSKKHNILVIAPDGNRSMMAHSVTFNKVIKVEPYHILDNVKAYKISGTPCDCVKIAKHAFDDFRIDLVVSGINLGHNLSSDILYSGTVSIALESVYFGIPAFSFSAYSHDDDYDFSDYAKICSEIIDKYYDKNYKGVFNVNFPDKNVEIKGQVITKLGKYVYDDECVKISENEFLIKGQETNKVSLDKNTDYEYIKKDFITITPLLYDKTDYKKIKELTSKNLK